MTEKDGTKTFSETMDKFMTIVENRHIVELVGDMLAACNNDVPAAIRFAAKFPIDSRRKKSVLEILNTKMAAYKQEQQNYLHGRT